MNTSKVTTASFYFHAKQFPFCISRNFEAFDAFCAKMQNWGSEMLQSIKAYNINSFCIYPSISQHAV